MARVRWRRSGGTLVEECESFLHGQLADRRGQRRSAVPAWAWMNLLAHGSASELQRVADERPRLARPSAWHQARSYLATEVMRYAQVYGSLEAVQADLLVPLELELASRAECARWEAQRLVAAVENVLDHHRSGGFRSTPLMDNRGWDKRCL